jgi:SecD/SecF fusion protein
MKEFRFRIILIVAFVALSLYLLYPTYADFTNTSEINKELVRLSDSIKIAQPTISDADLEDIINFKEDSIRVADPSIREARDKRVKLGLDLQGGMYLVMEVNTAKLLENLVKNADEDFNRMLAEAENEANLSDENLVSILSAKIQDSGKRLSRYFGSIREDDSEIIARLEEQESDAVTRAIEIISNRVNQYGVSEPNIQKQGARRIVVELPGISKEEEAKRLLQGSALLEFKFAREPEFVIPIMNRIDEVLAGKVDTADADTSSLDSDTTDVADLSEEEFARQHPFYSIALMTGNDPFPLVQEINMDKINSYLNRREVRNIIPDNVEFLFSAKPIITQDDINYYRLYMVNKEAELTGGVITDANANIDPQTTAPVVYMTMNSEGAREWARITGANIGKQCAIVLDGTVYSAPRINSKIPGGRSVIEGMEDLNEAKVLEIVLKAGALPAPVEIIEERTVGPSLGQDSINQGFNSTLIGFLLVAIFMIVYYKKAGTIADLALFFTIIFIMGILAGFQATLTLPGIAGLILTIGMAVDANVLIYERIREELSTGKTVKASIESGYANSYSAIFDSNITTFFTGIILYQFGSGPIQGFALTLMIGIVCSLFSALIVTRLVFDLMAAKGSKVNLG